MDIDLTAAILVKLILASILGGLIGLEREIHGRPAGFRTHLLVSLGSCLFVLTSIHFYRLYGNFTGTGPIGTDPARIAAQVVTGIGFLGAGAIIREKASIRGLTTAACLWVAAALGMAVGGGMFVTAAAVTALGLVSLLLLKKVENRLKRDTYAAITVWSSDLEGQMTRIEKVMADSQLDIMKVSIEKNTESREACFEFEVKFSAREAAWALIDRITALNGIKKVRLD
jgi:putative Mg2+ transporter-C (MgtC) family protein